MGKSHDYVWHSNWHGCPDIENTKETQQKIQVLHYRVQTDAVDTLSVKLCDVKEKHYEYVEHKVHKSKGFRSSCHNVEDENHQQRKVNQLEFVVFLCHHNHFLITVLDLLVFHINRSFVELNITGFFLYFLLWHFRLSAFGFSFSFFVPLSSFLITFDRINSFFRHVDDAHNEEESCGDKGEKDSASLTVLDE